MRLFGKGVGLARGPAVRPWPCRPVVAGAWRAIEDERIDALAARLPVQFGQGGLSLLLVRGRELDIDCLPGWVIQEVEATSAAGHRAVLRLLNDAVQLLPLDGSGAPFSIAGASSFQLGGKPAVRQYLRLFTTQIRHEGTAFRLIEALEGSGEGERGPPRPMTIRLTAEGARCRCLVAFGAELYSAGFLVRNNGEVELLEERYLHPTVSQQRSVFDGVWEIFSVN